MSEQEVIAGIAREALEEVAPSELVLFPAVQRAYFETGAAASVADVGRESPLGFGISGEVAALAPAALVVATEVFRFAAAQVGEAIKREAGAVVSDRVKTLFKRFHTEERDNSIGLSAAQLAEVRAVARNKALALRIPRNKAVILADAIVGTLAAPE